MIQYCEASTLFLLLLHSVFISYEIVCNHTQPLVTAANQNTKQAPRVDSHHVSISLLGLIAGIYEDTYSNST